MACIQQTHAEMMEEPISQSPPSKKIKLAAPQVDTQRDSKPDTKAEDVLDNLDRRQSCNEMESTTSFTSQPEKMAKDDLSQGYYLLNFKTILNMVLTSSPEQHVIADDAKRMVDGFMELSQSEQQLYVRLFLRKHQWLRSAKISYKDIADDLRPVLCGLVEHGYLVDESQLTDPSEVLSLLQLSELKDLRRELNLPSSSSVGSQKAQIIDGLFKHDRQHQPLFGKSQFLVTVVKRAKKKLGMCVKVDPHSVEVFSKVMVLFSLTNRHGREEENDFSQIIFRMLKVNVGTLKYPEYEVCVSQPLFDTKESFQRYFNATKEELVVVNAIDSKDDSVVEKSLRKIKTELEKELQTTSIEKITDTTMDSCIAPSQDFNTDIPVSSTSSNDIPLFLKPFSTCWLYANLLSKIAEYLEKRGKYQLANEILEQLLAQKEVCNGSRGRWWERLALNCDYHLKRKEKSLTVIKTALDDLHVRPPRRLSLQKRARKICESLSLNSRKMLKKASNSGTKSKKSKMSGKKASLPCSQFQLSDFPEMKLLPAPEVTISGAILRTDVKPVYLTPSTSLLQTSSSSSPAQSCTAIVGVEGYAMYHYNHIEGWPCVIHAEVSSFSSMFGLLLWDVIFMSGIVDVFRTPYQSGPLDLYSDCFYQNRKEKIEKRLKWIREATVEDISLEVESCWSKNVGTECVAVNWDLFDTVEDAKSLAMCMGGNLLSQICEVFSKDYSHSGGGLPDLTLWNPNSTSCKFVEVKGPGDRLSNKQIVWLSRLAEWGCCVEVCRVKGSSNKTLD